MKRIAVLRIRGGVKTPKTVNDTFKMLNLTRVNHCVIIDDRDTYKGMLQKVKDYAAFGEVSPEVVLRLLEKKARLPGDKKLEVKDLKSFVEKFFKFETELDELKIKKVFRLSPPRKGFKSTKKPYPYGDLGKRKSMDDLLLRMVR